MPAKHIQTARDEGMSAGLAAFLSAPSSKLSPNWPLVVGNGRRSEQSQLKAYTSCFGETVGKTRASKGTNPVVVERTISKKQQLIEALAEQLDMDVEQITALMIGETVEDEPEVVEESDLVISDEFITRDVAWALLGADEQYRSQVKNRGEVASSGQLYRLNAEGFLATGEVARLNDLAVA